MSDELKAWLSQELERRKWSHTELARQAGLSQAMVSRILSGERNASINFCHKIAAVLGEPPEKILRLAGILPSSPTPEEDPTLTELQDLIRNLPPAKRREVLRYVRFLYQSEDEK
ncbi:MAG: helix-turn-helix domain-containing protein [Anaerolineae bacterium]|nr:helix-turn-helix domain-containing protein [Anaerolineae bacterium]